MSNNFDFARCFAPDVADRLNRADDYLAYHEDSVAALESAGTALEQLVKHIAIKEGLSDTDFFGLRLEEKIEYLEKKSSCPHKIITWMSFIRKKRNKASHRNEAREYDAGVALKNAHRILKWCVENYQLGIATDYMERGYSDGPVVCIQGSLRPLNHNLRQNTLLVMM